MRNKLALALSINAILFGMAAANNPVEFKLNVGRAFTNDYKVASVNNTAIADGSASTTSGSYQFQKNDFDASAWNIEAGVSSMMDDWRVSGAISYNRGTNADVNSVAHDEIDAILDAITAANNHGNFNDAVTAATTAATFKKGKVTTLGAELGADYIYALDGGNIVAGVALDYRNNEFDLAAVSATSPKISYEHSAYYAKLGLGYETMSDEIGFSVRAGYGFGLKADARLAANSSASASPLPATGKLKFNKEDAGNLVELAAGVSYAMGDVYGINAVTLNTKWSKESWKQSKSDVASFTISEGGNAGVVKLQDPKASVKNFTVSLGVKF